MQTTHHSAWEPTGPGLAIVKHVLTGQIRGGNGAAAGTVALTWEIREGVAPCCSTLL